MSVCNNNINKFKISIIGTAGRNEDSNKMSKVLFTTVMNHVKHFIINILHLNFNNIILVSGGSAWIDHVAVRLYLENIFSDDNNKFAGLQLHLPCPIIKDINTNKYIFSPNSTAGTMLNSLHSNFCNKMGSNFHSIEDIISVQALNAVIISNYNGFLDRNKAVSKSEYIIAYTFNNSNIPKEGGTKHTWDLSKSNHKYHFSLYNIMNDFSNKSISNTSIISIFSSTKRKMNDKEEFNGRKEIKT